MSVSGVKRTLKLGNLCSETTLKSKFRFSQIISANILRQQTKQRVLDRATQDGDQIPLSVGPWSDSGPPAQSVTWRASD